MITVLRQNKIWIVRIKDFISSGIGYIPFEQKQFSRYDLAVKYLKDIMEE